jgi:hypothetical protein
MADRSTATAGKIAVSVVLSSLLMQPSMTERTPKTSKKVDPWGGLRGAAGK